MIVLLQLSPEEVDLVGRAGLGFACANYSGAAEQIRRGDHLEICPPAANLTSVFAPGGSSKY